MTDVTGNPEEERRADYYYQPWSQEAVCRYFYGKVMCYVASSLYYYIFLFFLTFISQFVIQSEDVVHHHVLDIKINFRS